MTLRRYGTAILTIALIATPLTAHGAMVKASDGAILSVDKTTNLSSGQKLIVSGKHFDETVGIYVEMCQIVPKGVRPSVCGGGADMTGSTGASVWISSNPPAYGVGLAKPFLPGGRFSVAIKVSPQIGTMDCRTAHCAVYVRADHTRGDDRSHDMYIPLTFKK
jgi:hypothetical protein